jgi:uncharacterized protein
VRVSTIERRRRPFRTRVWLVLAVALGVLLVLLLSLRGLAHFYTDYLWFRSVGFADVWSGLLAAKIVPAVVFTLALFLVLLASLTIADRLAPRMRTMGPEDELIDRYQQAVGRYSGRIRVGVAALFALIMGVSVSGEWQQWILFRNRVDFGVKDPQFHKDIGFYVFQLPFLKFIADWAFGALVIVLLVTAVAHYLNGGIRLQSPFQRVTPQVKAHLSVILALMALVKAVQYFLGQFELNFSKRGVVEGASYTDVHAQLQALRLLIFIAVIAAALFLWNISRRGWVLPIIAVGLWALLSLVVGTIYPAAIQKFRVDPNELSKERKYIDRNINATREAFNLKKVGVQPFAYRANLDTAALADNRQTIDNARLWDPAQLLNNYNAFQQLKTYYQFGDADVDRYTLGDKVTQVLIAARALDRANLPSQSWVARHLVYTHGYGLAVSPTNKADTGGRPDYLLGDIPPRANDPAVQLTQPGIYFGENLSGYALVDAKAAEFDHPRQGQADATTRYTGSGGVVLSSWLKRAAFALRFGDINPLISGQVNTKTRVLYLRDIRDRVQKAAPFLKYDQDPYPVIIDGKVVWVLDAYTVTDRYPYSQATGGNGGLAGQFNYVRNSVKATVDAYNGTIRFYVIDKHDPIIRAYRKAFPELFSDFSKMPPRLREHLRYPEDLFKTQTDVYASYHVTSATTFYNKADLWAVSPDPGSGAIGALSADSSSTTAASENKPQAASSSGRRIDPVYLLIRLPGQTKASFLILRPFVPVSHNNALTQLVSFMVAKSDPADYGQIESFVLPAGLAVTGPDQVNQVINSTQEISQQFTLLGQLSTGSRVVQGSLQLIPVNNSILYIRPIYVQAQQGSQLPSFRFVVVFYNEKAVIGDNLLAALGKFPEFAGVAPPPTSASGGGGGGGTTPPPQAAASVQDLLNQATDLFNQAQDALANKDLAKYQSLINQVGDKIKQAQQAAAATPTSSTTTPVRQVGARSR